MLSNDYNLVSACHEVTCHSQLLEVPSKSQSCGMIKMIINDKRGRAVHTFARSFEIKCIFLKIHRRFRLGF